ncbi:TRAP transporter large permease subunit [Marinobacterium sp. CAU 1594]|nr:TRAP transporter large permease subunit [Marinobacterium arenosum]
MLALMRTPIFIVIAAAALYGFYRQEIHLSVVAVEIYRITETPILLALPLFSFAGYLLAATGASQRMLRLNEALLGWLPASLPIVAFISCALFTALTGASGVTIVALGALLYPALQQSGYSQKFSLGLVTASGSLGLLLVPSMPLILYGVVVQQLNLPIQLNLTDLFLAGLLPALLMVLLLSLWSLWKSRQHPQAIKPFSLARLRDALWEARGELPLPFLLLGGVYSGLISISEAAAVTALYVLIVELLVYRELPLRQIPAVLIKSSILVGEIILILALALALSGLLVDAEVPTRLFELIRDHVDSRFQFLLLLNLLLLLLGAFLDIFSAIVIMVPLLLPVALAYGVDPIHLGIIFLANMQLGYFTPPVGMNLFIASARFNQPITTLYRATWPFFVVLLIAVLLITYLPVLSLGLLG